jgi:ankyrin repeat protein
MYYGSSVHGKLARFKFQIDYITEDLKMFKREDADLQRHSNDLLAALHNNQPLLVQTLCQTRDHASLHLPNLYTADDKNNYLHWAVKHNLFFFIPLLMDHGASIFHTNAEGQTPIELAASKGHWDCVKAIAQRRRVHMHDSAGYGKVLLKAVNQNQSIEIIKVLLEAKAPVNFTFKDGNTCLHRVVELNRVDLISLFLADSDNTNLTQLNDKGQTPIELAASKGHWDCVKAIAQRRRVRTHDSAGYDKVLLEAVNQNQPIEIIKVLLEAKAPTNFVFNDGKVCLDWAIINKNEAVAQLLMRYGACSSSRNGEGLITISPEGKLPQRSQLTASIQTLTTPDVKLDNTKIEIAATEKNPSPKIETKKERPKSKVAGYFWKDSETPKPSFICSLRDGHPYHEKGSALHHYYYDEFKEDPNAHDYDPHPHDRYKSPPHA